MRSPLTAGLAVAALVLASCGSDSSSGLGDEQQRVADILTEAANEVGITLDSDCVNENLGELTDDDAKALADSGLEGNAEISDDAEAIGDAMFTDCVDAESYGKSVAESIADSDESIDQSCLEDEFDGLGVQEIDEVASDAVLRCSGG
jgi:hypothetical protein